MGVGMRWLGREGMEMGMWQGCWEGWDGIGMQEDWEGFGAGGSKVEMQKLGELIGSLE